MSYKEGAFIKVCIVLVLLCFIIPAGVPVGAVEDTSSAVPAGKSAELVPEDNADSGVKVSMERISLDLKGIEITELFRILSIKLGLTIVPTKNVSGRVNIFLNNLTFENALDVILISQDLACERKGNVINVMTSSEYEKLYGKKYNERRKIKNIKLTYAKPATVFAALAQVKSDIGKVVVDEASGNILLIDVPDRLELMEKSVLEMDQPLETAVFDIKYAKSADLKAHLTGAITAGLGEFFVDERSSKVIVSDLPDKIDKIRRMVKAFDTESQEVFIETEIVQIVLNDQYQRGVDWEKLFSKNSLKGLDFVGKFPVSPTLSAYQKMSVGTLDSNSYTLMVNMLKTYGDTKILSRPRLAVLNNEEAKIMVGAREAYVTQTLSQAEATTVTSENIQFIDVGVKLNVVPTINREGYITMKIKPEVSNVRETITTSLGSRIPIVETSEAETVVKIKDGAMIMIGGLMKQEYRDDRSELPGLGRIPLVGMLFGTRSLQKKTTELVVFMTPHIMKGNAPVEDSEPEKLIPGDIMPKDLAKSIINRKLGEIKLNGEESAEIGGLIKGKLEGLKIPSQEKPLPQASQGCTRVESVTKSALSKTDEIEDKIKGIKE